jgi:hypothetical protein
MSLDSEVQALTSAAIDLFDAVTDTKAIAEEAVSQATSQAVLADQSAEAALAVKQDLEANWSDKLLQAASEAALATQKASEAQGFAATAEASAALAMTVATPTADTVSALRELADPLAVRVITVFGFGASGDGGGGFWRYDPASSDADNGGTVVKPTAIASNDPGRWLRVFSGNVDLAWFGAVRDGVTDDYAAWVAANSAASDLGVGIALTSGDSAIKQAITLTVPVHFTEGAKIVPYPTWDVSGATTWSDTVTYAKDDIVLYRGEYYKSVINNNLSTITDLIPRRSNISPEGGNTAYWTRHVTLTLSAGYYAGDYQHVFNTTTGGGIVITTGRFSDSSVLSPAHWGAKVGGLVDCTLALQSCFNSVKYASEQAFNPVTVAGMSNMGGNVFIPQGVWRMTAGAVMWSGTVVNGVGKGSVLRLDDNVDDVIMLQMGCGTFVGGNTSANYSVFTSVNRLAFVGLGARTQAVGLHPQTGLFGGVYKDLYFCTRYGFRMVNVQYTQSSVFDNIQTFGNLTNQNIGYVDQILRLQGNTNVIKNLAKEIGTGNSFDPYVLVTGPSVGVVHTTSDGTLGTWKQNDELSHMHMFGGAYGNGKRVLVGDAGMCRVSEDSEVTEYLKDAHTSALWSVAYNGTDTWVAVGEQGAMAYCRDSALAPDVYRSGGFMGYIAGTTLTVTRAGVALIVAGHSLFPDHGILPGTYIVSQLGGTAGGVGTYEVSRSQTVGASGSVYYMTADSWVPLPYLTKSKLKSVCYGGGLWVAVGFRYSPTGNYTEILTSPDGATWTDVANTLTFNARGACYGNGLFVIVGDSGKIATSTDGATWTLQTSGVSTKLNGVAYHDNTYMAVGASGAVLASTDGITWTARTSNTTAELYDATYSGSLWLVCGYPNKITISPDGVTWTAYDGGAGYVPLGPSVFYTVVWDGAQFVLGSSANGDPVPNDVINTTISGAGGNQFEHILFEQVCSRNKSLLTLEYARKTRIKGIWFEAAGVSRYFELLSTTSVDVDQFNTVIGTASRTLKISGLSSLYVNGSVDLIFDKVNKDPSAEMGALETTSGDLFADTYPNGRSGESITTLRSPTLQGSTQYRALTRQENQRNGGQIMVNTNFAHNGWGWNITGTQPTPVYSASSQGAGKVMSLVWETGGGVTWRQRITVGAEMVGTPVTVQVSGNILDYQLASTAAAIIPYINGAGISSTNNVSQITGKRGWCTNSLTAYIGAAGTLDVGFVIFGSAGVTTLISDCTASFGNAAATASPIVGCLELSSVNPATGILTLNSASILAGSGSPEGVVTAPAGSLYLCTDGGVGGSIFVKESGTGNTGWTAK